MDASIIIVNWNTRDLLAQCLESVYTHPPNGDFEIFVVDNASTDGSAAMVRERFSQVRLIENAENLGFARANNIGIINSFGRYILLLNSDTVVLPDGLSRLVAFMDTHPDAAVIGPKSLNADGTFQASYVDFPTLMSELIVITGLARCLRGGYYPGHSLRQSLTVREADWVGGACMLVRRTAIQEVGVLDERFSMYAEEMDWCFRMRQRGWQVYYLPDAEIIHVGGASTPRNKALKRLRLRTSELLFFSKHYSKRQMLTLRGLILVVSLPRTISSMLCNLIAPSLKNREHLSIEWAQLQLAIRPVSEKLNSHHRKTRKKP